MVFISQRDETATGGRHHRWVSSVREVLDAEVVEGDGRRFDLSIIGEDLLESRHLEFPTDVYVADNRFIERRALVQAVWRF